MNGGAAFPWCGAKCRAHSCPYTTCLRITNLPLPLNLPGGVRVPCNGVLFCDITFQTGLGCSGGRIGRIFIAA